MKRIGLVGVLVVAVLLSVKWCCGTDHGSNRDVTRTSSTRNHRDELDPAKVEMRARQDTVRRALARAKSQAAAKSDQTPSDLGEVEKRHPGFNAAFARATTASGFRDMYKCKELIVKNDPLDTRTRDYTLVDHYEPDGNGNLVLDRSDAVPETDDDPEFYECLSEQRMNHPSTIAVTPGMKVSGGFTVYDPGRMLNLPITADSIETILRDDNQQLGEIPTDDPYREGVRMQIALFECYRDKGTDPDQRVECLELVSGSQPNGATAP